MTITATDTLFTLFINRKPPFCVSSYYKLNITRSLKFGIYCYSWHFVDLISGRLNNEENKKRGFCGTSKMLVNSGQEEEK